MDEVSDRSRGVALILAVVGGMFGAHRFYAGKTASGVGMICTFGGMGLWWLYDCVLVAAGEFRDWDDRRIVNWSNEPAPARIRSGESNQQVLQAMDEMRSDMYDLQERVDFMERMLTEVRHRQVVPPASPPPRSGS